MNLQNFVPGRLMRVDRRGIANSLATIATMLALSACWQARAADDFRSFERCVDEEAKKVVDQCALGLTDPMEARPCLWAIPGIINLALANQVLAICRPQAPPEDDEFVYSNNPYYRYVIGSMHALVEKVIGEAVARKLENPPRTGRETGGGRTAPRRNWQRMRSAVWRNSVNG